MSRAARDVGELLAAQLDAIEADLKARALPYRAILNVRDLHKRSIHRHAGEDHCSICEHCSRLAGGYVPWPCETVTALDDAS